MLDLILPVDKSEGSWKLPSQGTSSLCCDKSLNAFKFGFCCFLKVTVVTIGKLGSFGKAEARNMDVAVAVGQPELQQ